MGVVLSWINSNIGEDDRQGEAREENQPQSAWAMVSTLVPTLILTTIYLIVFLSTRVSQKRFYAPRSYLGSLRARERSPELPKSLFGWYRTLWKIPDMHALKRQSLDAYLFLRYLRVCTAICFISLLITWPVLLPINITGGNGKTQLELLSYSNINILTQGQRLYAHAIMAWATYGFVLYMITRECIFYINLRQAYLLSPKSANLISSRTVLFTCVPREYQDESRIRAIFGNTVRHVWFAGNTKNVDQAVKTRDETAMQLEKAEVKYLKNVEKLHRATKARAEKQNAELDPRDIAEPCMLDTIRPQHRTGFLGLLGAKVDSVAWFRHKLRTSCPEARSYQEAWKMGNFTKVPAVFVEFNTHTEAQTAYQLVTHHHGFRMTPKYIGVKPDEVIWQNLSLSWWRIVASQYLVYAFIGALIIFWAIPVGVVGVVSQVSVLQKLPGLTWLDQIPEQILGVVSGLLPAYALSLLMSLVPSILRFCARASGAATQAEVELFVQNSYFIFQLVQVFLIRTITDTAATAIVQIVQDPTSVFDTLAEALPTSANFYVSYFIIQGFAVAVDVLTQVVKCTVFNILYKVGAGTPRKMYSRWTSLESLSWGSILPVHTCIVVISITYSIISPFLLAWSTIGLYIFYQAYRYNIIFVSETKVHTSGLFYPRALKQLFAGVYIAEVCLIGIFIISKAIGPAIMTLLFLVFTVLYQITLGRALDPLLYNMPCTIQAEEEILLNAQSDDDTMSTILEEGFHAGESSHPSSGRQSRRASEKMPEIRRPSEPVSTMSGRSTLHNVTTRRQHNYKPSFLQKFLRPWKFTDYWTLRRIVCRGSEFNLPEMYSEEIESEAYLPPSVKTQAPLIWIPKDPVGVSRMEINDAFGIVEMTDDGCTLDGKGRMKWDEVEARPPIWMEKVNY